MFRPTDVLHKVINFYDNFNILSPSSCTHITAV